MIDRSQPLDSSTALTPPRPVRHGARHHEARLGRRLLAAIVLASSALALVATCVQLYIDYARDRDEIEREFALIEQGYVPSLSNSLWSLDRSQIQLQLEGLARMRDVRYARVQGELGERFEVGRAEDGRIIERRWTLVAPKGGATGLGTLTVGVDLQGVYQRLVQRSLIIFVTQSIKTALIALFILYLVRRWVTRHLEKMAAHARGLSMNGLDRPLALLRRRAAAPDELDNVVEAMNDMSARLAGQLAARTAAEEALRRHRDSLEEQVTQRTAELRLAKERAELASAAKSRFLSRMSHELRTPLNGILGYAQILQADRSLGPGQKRGLDVIRKSGEHLLALIVDILDLARTEAGRSELTPGEIVLRPFLRGVVDIVRVKADEKGLGVGLDVDPVVPENLFSDETRLRQVLLNLLGNAIKFTEHGTVGVGVAPGAAGRIRLDVWDTGPGIPADLHDRLFQPFEQGGGAKQRAAGTGLGLAISRHLVGQMGGELRVEARPKGGSRFTFETLTDLRQAPEAAGGGR